MCKQLSKLPGWSPDNIVLSLLLHPFTQSSKQPKTHFLSPSQKLLEPKKIYSFPLRNSLNILILFYFLSSRIHGWTKAGIPSGDNCTGSKPLTFENIWDRTGGSNVSNLKWTEWPRSVFDTSTLHLPTYRDHTVLRARIFKVIEHPIHSS